SPLIDKALTPPLPERIVFLVQAEVAARIAAAPGSKPYGALSVGVQAVCRVERLFTVRAGAFHPRPRVDSALLRLTPLAVPLVAPAELAAFREFVTACFTRRRKQLRNVVMAATGRPAAVVRAGLSEPELAAKVRDILGLRRTYRVMLVGAGRIGGALIQYPGFRQRGFHVGAIYDRDPKKIGSRWNGLVVRDVRHIEADLAREPTDIAIVV